MILCAQCGTPVTRSPFLHPVTKQIVCWRCYPFVCDRCGATTRQFSVDMNGEELCDKCFDKQTLRESRKFGDPGDGTLFPAR